MHVCVKKILFPQYRKSYRKKCLSFPALQTCSQGSPEEDWSFPVCVCSWLSSCPSEPVCPLSLPLSDFDPWSSSGCEQNESEPIPANCTGCAQVFPLKVTLLEDTPKTFERLRPLVIKVGKKPGFPMNSLPTKGRIKPCEAVVTHCGLLCLSVSPRQGRLCCLQRFSISHASTLKPQRASLRGFSPSGGAAFLRGGSHFLTHGESGGCLACM